MPGARWRYVSKTLPWPREPCESTRVQLCGRLSVEVGGVQLAERLRGRQVRLLLAYLLLNRSRHVGREELIGARVARSCARHRRTRRCARCSRALRSARRRLGAGRPRGADPGASPSRCGSTSRRPAAELQRAVQALERGDARAAWALAQVPLNIASRGLLPGAQAGWLESHRRELEDVRLQALEVVGRRGPADGRCRS